MKKYISCLLILLLCLFVLISMLSGCRDDGGDASTPPADNSELVADITEGEADTEANASESNEEPVSDDGMALGSWQDALALPDLPERAQHLLTYGYSSPSYTVEFMPGLVVNVYDDYYASCFVSWDIINEVFPLVDDPRCCDIHVYANPYDAPQWEISVKFEKGWLVQYNFPTNAQDSHETIDINTSEGVYSLGYWKDGFNTKGRYGTLGSFWDPTHPALRCAIYALPKENSFCDRVLWTDLQVDKS